jgi:homoserine O-acetyltransferase
LQVDQFIQKYNQVHRCQQGFRTAAESVHPAVTHGSGSVEAAARQSKIPQLIVAVTNDHLVNPTPALLWAKTIHAQTYVSSGDCGYRITECDQPAITAAVRAFLAAQ